MITIFMQFIQEMAMDVFICVQIEEEGPVR